MAKLRILLQVIPRIQSNRLLKLTVENKNINLLIIKKYN